MISRQYIKHAGLKVVEIVAGNLFLTPPVQAVWRRLPIPASGPNTQGKRPETLKHLRVAVVAHVFYPALLPEILACWAHVLAGAKAERLADRVALHITTVDSLSGDIAERLRRAGVNLADVTVHVGPNRGRDIAPFIGLLNKGVLDGYDAVLKLHTKRSPHLKTGDLRRGLLYAVLAGSLRQTRRALKLLSDPNVGMVGWGLSFRKKPSWWMGNEARVRMLTNRMTPCPPATCGFFEGSMFWVRPAALASLRSIAVTVDEFESELGQTDGTLHHAIERAFTLSAWAGGFRVCGMSGDALKPLLKGDCTLLVQTNPT